MTVSVVETDRRAKSESNKKTSQNAQIYPRTTLPHKCNNNTTVNMSWNICISAVNALFLLHVKLTVVPMSLNRIPHGDQVEQHYKATVHNSLPRLNQQEWIIHGGWNWYSGLQPGNTPLRTFKNGWVSYLFSNSQSFVPGSTISNCYRNEPCIISQVRLERVAVFDLNVSRYYKDV